MLNFGEVRRAQLAKATLLTSTLMPLGTFRSFKFCSDTKERVVVRKTTGSYRTYPCLVKLQPGFLKLHWKTCFRVELRPWFLSLQWRICHSGEYSDDVGDNGQNNYFSLVPYFKLLYMSWNLNRKMLNVLLRNLIGLRMGYFGNFVLKLICKINISLSNGSMRFKFWIFSILTL